MLDKKWRKGAESSMQGRKIQVVTDFGTGK
jgi:hypothetical protein